MFFTISTICRKIVRMSIALFDRMTILHLSRVNDTRTTQHTTHTRGTTMSKTATTNYGDLCDANTNDTIRPATRREAMESLSERCANGAIEVDGQTVWVSGVEHAQVCGRDIQIDISGGRVCWLSMVATDLTPSIRSELEEAIMEEDDDTGRMMASESGEASIGGVWYRWGH